MYAGVEERWRRREGCHEAAWPPITKSRSTPIEDVGELGSVPPHYPPTGPVPTGQGAKRPLDADVRRQDGGDRRSGTRGALSIASPCKRHHAQGVPMGRSMSTVIVIRCRSEGQTRASRFLGRSATRGGGSPRRPPATPGAERGKPAPKTPSSTNSTSGAGADGSGKARSASAVRVFDRPGPAGAWGKTNGMARVNVIRRFGVWRPTGPGRQRRLPPVLNVTGHLSSWRVPSWPPGC